MRLYKDVPESFLCYASKNQITGQCDIEACIKKTKQSHGGTIVAQISDGNPIDGGYRIQGAWVPPEIADKLIAVINEWRESKGIPRKSA